MRPRNGDACATIGGPIPSNNTFESSFTDFGKRYVDRAKEKGGTLNRHTSSELCMVIPAYGAMFQLLFFVRDVRGAVLLLSVVWRRYAIFGIQRKIRTLHLTSESLR